MSKSVSIDKGVSMEKGKAKEKRMPRAFHRFSLKPRMRAKNPAGKMECKDFEKRIPDFIEKKMDYPTLKRFYEHVQQCRDCREELEIQFLVWKGMERLEEGNAFDLQSELKQRMEEAVKSIRYHGVFLCIGIAMEIVAVGLLAGIVIWILL